jgi:myo-inositol-1(or 4)-monophosphatase
MTLHDYLNVAQRAADAGGKVLETWFERGVTVTQKDPQASFNLVSEADVEAEQAIVRVIRDAFPDHAILGEESHRDDVSAEHLWVVDPLDGTNNSVHAVPHFAVSIAFYRDGDAQCGVIYNPIQGDRFVAVRGQGATRNGRPIRVVEDRRLDQVLVGVGFYYDRGAMMESTLAAVRDLFHKHIHGIRRFGTASLDLAQVACGRFGGYFEYKLSPWDFAAGWLLVEEAGGKVTSCNGAPLKLEKTGLLASNAFLHASILEIVERHLLNRP